MIEDSNINNKEEDDVNEGKIVYGEDSRCPKINWEPVAKVEESKGLDPYEDAPQSVKDFHENYCNMWLRGKRSR